MMVPKTTVLITESGGYGYTGRQYTVGNVPVGLAYMGYFVSSLAKVLPAKPNKLTTCRTTSITHAPACCSEHAC